MNKVKLYISSILVLLVMLCQCQFVHADNATSKEVGTTSSKFSVSPSGGAVYSMVIDVPKGYGNMQPNISLTYNSQSGYGIAGYGVSISGLSSITRGCKDIYHDGAAKGIGYSMDDAYYLDGKRLILQSGNAGQDGACYVPEGEPFTKVYFHGYDGATWIEVKTQNGLTYQYGNNQSSKVTFFSNQKSVVVSWLLNRASDTKGRYVSYTYAGGGLIKYPQSIVYGITNASSVISSVHFDYEPVKNKCTQVVNIGGVSQSLTTRLKSITSSTGSSVYRRYECEYDSILDDSKIKYSRLSRLIEKNGSGAALNPIVLNWKGLPAYTPKMLTPDVDIEHKDYGQVVDDMVLMCADMNGDGVSDIIKVANVKDNYISYGGYTHFEPASYAYLFYSNIASNGTVSYRYVKSIRLGANMNFDDLKNYLSGTNSLDMDGDGKGDVVILQTEVVSGRTGLDMTFLSDSYGEVSGCYVLQNSSKQPLTLSLDMDKDGRDEYLCVEKDGKDNKYFGGIVSMKMRGSLNFTTCSFVLSQKPTKVFAADYNNDGLVDLIFLHDKGYTIYYNQGGKDLASMFNESHKYYFNNSNGLKDQWRIVQGDFNGDGLTDFVYFQQSWDFFFALNNGNGTFNIRKAATLDITDYGSSKKDDEEFLLLPYDMDGDGKTDLMIVKGDFKRHHDLTSSYFRYKNTQLAWLRSDGNKLVLDKENYIDSEADAKEKNYLLGSFTADGQPGVLHYGKDIANFSNSDAVKIRAYVNGAYNITSGKVEKFMDGLGNTHIITYNSLQNPSCYVAQKNAQYPMIDVHVALPVVSSVTQSNGAAALLKSNYSYEGLKCHAQGKGLLGFAKTTIEHATLNQKIQSEVIAWDTSYFVPTQVRTVISVGSEKATSVISYSILPKNKTYFSYASNQLDTDYDGYNTKNVLAYNTDYGYVTSQAQYFDGESMYKKVQYDGYQQKAGVYLPTLITNTQKHADDSKPFTQKTVLAYDDHGALTKRVDYASTPMALTTSYVYDQFYNVTSVDKSGIGVSSLKQKTEYDSNGRFVVKTYQEPNALTTEYTHDIWGNVLRQVQYADVANRQVTTYVYDGWGRMVSSTNPMGISKKAVYERLGGSSTAYRVVTTEDNASSSFTIYDALGREYVSQCDIEGHLKKTIAFQYAANGQKLQVSTMIGSIRDVQRYTYDLRGRLTGEIFDTRGRSLTYKYNGRTITTIDGGKSYVKELDAWGNTKCSSDPISRISYLYNSNGNPSAVSTNGSTVSMTYDEAGNKVSITDPDAGTLTYVYAADGKILAQKDARGIETKYTYDVWGKLLQKTVGNMTFVNTYGTSGIEKNLLVKRTHGSFYEAYTHDRFGRLTQKVRNPYGKKLFETDYVYNSKNQLMKITYPGGLAVSYGYDSNGFQVSAHSNGLLLDSLASYNGLVAVHQLPYGMTYKRTLGSKLSLQNLQIQKGNVTLFNMGFEYDAQSGNLLSRTGMVADKESFEYDDLDRLIGVKSGNATSLNISYADNGNIMSKTDVGNYVYNGVKPHAVMSIDNSEAYLWRTDMTTEFNDMGKIKLVSQRQVYPIDLSYIYGADGELWQLNYTPRVRSTDVGGHKAWSRYYDDDYESLVSARFHREFYYLTDNVMAVRDDEGIFNYYVLAKDNLGSIVKVYNSKAEPVLEASYDAWGKQTVSLAKDDMNLLLRGYCGHTMLNEFDLIDMKGRLYDPVVGRFLSPDNYVQTPDNSQNYNRYSYCLNNPLKYTDPSGEFIGIDDALAIITGGVINLGVNLFEGNVKNVWQGATLFLTGAIAGETALYGQAWASAVIVGAGNSIVNQGFINGFGHIDWSQVGTSTVMSLATSYVAGVLGQSLDGVVGNLTSSISDDLLRNVADGAIYGTISGFAVGTGLALANGENIGNALLEGVHQAGIGVVTGSLSGLSDGVREIHQQQKDAILNMKLNANIDPNDIVRETLSNPKTPVGEGTNSVYVGRDEHGNVRYVGITDRNPSDRFAEHYNSGTNRSSLQYETLKRTGHLSRTQARIIEQKLINAYGMKQFGGVLYNKVNSIRPGKLWSDYGIVNN